MVVLSGCADGFDGFLFGVEPFSETFSPMHTEVSHPFLPAFVKVNPFVPRNIDRRPFGVPSVVVGTRNSEVRYSVVCGVTIDVIDPTTREFTIDIQPRKPVGEVHSFSHTYLFVTQWHFPTRRFFVKTPTSEPSPENTGVWIVVKRRHQTVMGEGSSDFHNQKKRSATGSEIPLLTLPEFPPRILGLSLTSRRGGDYLTTEHFVN